MTIPIWTTPSGFLFTATELLYTSTIIQASGTNIAYQLLSGHLPAGLNLSSTGTIFGTPVAVTTTATSKFVVRARSTSSIADRTFIIDVDGPDLPQWITPSGYLPVGVFGEYFAFNNQYVDYQLVVSLPETPSSSKVQYYIESKEGKLPPGLSLSIDGKITGFVKDKLSFDGDISPTGGYDSEFYDGYTYDHGTSYIGTEGTDVPAGTPKIYQFRVTASDGINSLKRDFKICVTSVKILQFNSDSMPDSITLSTSTSSIQPLQWLIDSDLGDIRASNWISFAVGSYDPNPLDGPVTYNLITGTTVFETLPEDLKLDKGTGRIYGYVPYQPAYKLNYNFEIEAIKQNKFTKELFTTTNTFSLTVKGEVESTIQWVTNDDLGQIDEGLISEIYVQAKQLKTNYPIKYNLIGGSLPQGLSLSRDGSISGRVAYDTTGTYTFTVFASDVYELSAIEKTFKLEVTKYNNRVYTDIYVRPFLSLDKRKQYRDFVSNEFTFDPKVMYRYFDPNFGVQTDIKMYLQFGIERVNLQEYAYALQENFYRKRLFFGEIKLAIAKDQNGQDLYEVIYVDIVDDMQNAPRLIYDDNDIYYPGSIENMRYKLSKLVLPNYTYVDIDEFNRPRFMRTAQPGEYRTLGYIPVVPICYALPGQGSKILSRIKISKFNFNIFDFEIDRIIVENPLDANSAKYLIMERQSIGDRIPSDNYIFGLDEIRIDIDDEKPLSRE